MAISSVIASDTDVRAFIDEYFKAWEGTDENRILSYYAETVSLEIPGALIKGKAAFRDQFVRPFVTGFPGNRHIVKNMIFGKNVVVVEWTFEAAHKGAFAGTAATGTAVKLPGCGVYEFDPINRQITGARIYFDITTLLKQISPASGAAESSDIVVRFTHLSKGTDLSVTRVWRSEPGQNQYQSLMDAARGMAHCFVVQAIR
jgi:steroid delta-isomerase-like uncharacterized protein